MDASASEGYGVVVLLPGSGGLRTNGREVSPSGLKPASLPQVIGQYSFVSSAAVPEPTSMAIFGLGALGMAYHARRKSMV